MAESPWKRWSTPAFVGVFLLLTSVALTNRIMRLRHSQHFILDLLIVAVSIAFLVPTVNRLLRGQIRRVRDIPRRMLVLDIALGIYYAIAVDVPFYSSPPQIHHVLQGYALYTKVEDALHIGNPRQHADERVEIYGGGPFLRTMQTNTPERVAPDTAACAAFDENIRRYEIDREPLLAQPIAAVEARCFMLGGDEQRAADEYVIATTFAGSTPSQAFALHTALIHQDPGAAAVLLGRIEANPQGHDRLTLCADLRMPPYVNRTEATNIIDIARWLHDHSATAENLDCSRRSS